MRDEKYYIDLVWLKGGIILFLMGIIIFLFLFVYTYISFEVEGKINSVYPSAIYGDLILMIIGALFIFLSFKEVEKKYETPIKSLQELNLAKETGLITEEEYEEKKKEILGRM